MNKFRIKGQLSLRCLAKNDKLLLSNLNLII